MLELQEGKKVIKKKKKIVKFKGSHIGRVFSKVLTVE